MNLKSKIRKATLKTNLKKPREKTHMCLANRSPLRELNAMVAVRREGRESQDEIDQGAVEASDSESPTGAARKAT